MAVLRRSIGHDVIPSEPRCPDQRPASSVRFTAYQKTTYSNIITLDMGGTSADVGLIRDREADFGTTRDVAGFPVRLPMVDIHTVGAGGGSIAWFDRDGLLKVGPQSAGADPGPACYGAGGTEPTVSDANAVLGRLAPTGLLDGAMALDFTAARGAIAPIAIQLGFSVEKTAYGMIEIVVANMVRAVRKISIERGYDPRAILCSWRSGVREDFMRSKSRRCSASRPLLFPLRLEFCVLRDW